MKRADGRAADQLRPTRITVNFTKYAEGSVLIETGETRVLCNASVEEKVPPHLKDLGTGWVTAEYDMLPRATYTRRSRDVSKLKIASRSAEISRLIGRSLRAVCDMEVLGPRTVTIDCDVLQADGGTRTASVTGAYVALKIATDKLVRDGVIERSPLKEAVAAVSVGLVDGEPLLDLPYVEDSRAEADVNVVRTESGGLVEVQGTGEQRPFTKAELEALLRLAEKGTDELMASQKAAIASAQPLEKVVLATQNKGKLREMAELLEPLKLAVLSPAEAGVSAFPEETGVTFEENALIKARAMAKAAGLPAVADDSGLCVDALDGAPGIYSARYAGVGAGDGDRIVKLLEAMEGLPAHKRSAHFVSALAFALPDGRAFVVRGECHGFITEAPRGNGGFGYDPVFYYPPFDRTFGETPETEKNMVSHRANASVKFLEKLAALAAGKEAL